MHNSRPDSEVKSCRSCTSSQEAGGSILEWFFRAKILMILADEGNICNLNRQVHR